MSTARITWAWPTTRTDGSAFTAGTVLTGSVYDTASPTPTVPVGGPADWRTGPGLVDVTETPGTTHGFYVVVSDGSLQSAPSATVTGTAPSAPPNPVTGVAVTFI